MGDLRNPSPAASRTMHRGSGWTLGLPCAGSEFFGPLHHLAHSSDSTGKALGPENREVLPPRGSPEWASKRIPIPRCLADGWSPLSRGSPRGRQHKHSSVLYSPPN